MLRERPARSAASVCDICRAIRRRARRAPIACDWAANSVETTFDCEMRMLVKSRINEIMLAYTSILLMISVTVNDLIDKTIIYSLMIVYRYMSVRWQRNMDALPRSHTTFHFFGLDSAGTVSCYLPAVLLMLALYLQRRTVEHSKNSPPCAPGGALALFKRIVAPHQWCNSIM